MEAILVVVLSNLLGNCNCLPSPVVSLAPQLAMDPGQASKVNVLSIGVPVPEQESIANLFRQLARRRPRGGKKSRPEPWA